MPVASDHGERFTRLKAAIGSPARDLAATDERMARIEGRVVVARGRPFSERMAKAPDGADGRCKTPETRAASAREIPKSTRWRTRTWG